MEVRLMEPMCRHTSFRTGGPADWFVIPDTPEELAAALAVCKKTDTPWYILGNGTNLLVGDKGIRGAVFSMERFDRMEVSGTRIRAGAGLLLSRLANGAFKEGLSGLEFAAGIPGSVGGAAVMNAGAYGSEIKNCLVSAAALDPEGRVHTYKAEELSLGYRTSRFLTSGEIVLEAEFSLERGKKEEIQAKMEELSRKRREKQPLEYPSAGSTFKRPEGAYAAALIEQCGLKGFRIGDAMVSEKHSGFLINAGNATCREVLELAAHVQRVVKEQTGFTLEREVQLLR